MILRKIVAEILKILLTFCFISLLVLLGPTFACF